MDSQELWVPDPYTSQPVLQSIEKQSSVPWGQPFPLPSYEASHMLARATTALSDPPSRTPQTQPIRASQTPLLQSTRQLTKDDRLHILRLAISHGDTWGRVTNRLFWQKVATEFERTTGKKHKTLGRAANDLIKARRKAVADKDSSETKSKSSYTNAIDQWISIVDNYKAVEDARKEGQAQKDQEIASMNNWRNNCLKLFVDRDEPDRIARKRKAQAEAIDNFEEDEDEDEDNVNCGPFRDRPFFIDQSTPVDSISPSLTSTPTPITDRRRVRRRTETSQDSIPNLSADFHRLVNAFVARGASRQEGGGNLDISKLEADLTELKTKVRGLEEGIGSILRILQNRP